MREWGGKLFVEGSCYLVVIGEVNIVKSDWLVRCLGGFLSREGTEEGPEVRGIVPMGATLDLLSPCFTL